MPNQCPQQVTNGMPPSNGKHKQPKYKNEAKNKQAYGNGVTNLNFAFMVSHLLQSHVFCSSSYKSLKQIKSEDSSNKIKSKIKRNGI